VSAFRPISPKSALRLLDAAQIRADTQRMLVDLAVAGAVKGYARLIERKNRRAAR